MNRFNTPHFALRDQILGLDAKKVIDAEFREIRPNPVKEVTRSAWSSLRQLLAHIFSGRAQVFGRTTPRRKWAARLRW